MHSLEHRLGRWVSSINAKVIADRCRRDFPPGRPLDDKQRANFIRTLRAALGLFCSPLVIDEIATEVERDLSGATASKHVFAIASEADLHRARSATRDLCLAVGATPTQALRMATVVSELARNIVSYTPGGQVSIDALPGPPPSIFIVARDRGLGIPNLPDILAGRYRSKTGQGRGIRGVKQIMESFQVETGPRGTVISTGSKLQ